MYIYKTKGVCSKEIHLELEGDTIKSVNFVGGCNGNTKGISALAQGMNADEFIKRCSQITCGVKESSCPAQLAKAIEECRNA